MASPGPRRFARGGEGVAFHLETVRAILVFHYIRVRILLPLRPCIIFPLISYSLTYFSARVIGEEDGEK